MAEAAVLLSSCSGDYPGFLNTTVQLAPSFKPDDFRISAGGEVAEVRVINLYPDQIINFETFETLSVAGRAVQPDPDRDILKLSVVERYGKNGQVASGLVRGFQLKSGAIASSVSHDHHNIVVVGTNDDDMYTAVRELEKHQGGFVAVVDGNVQGVLPLPIAGLMSPLSANEVMEGMESLNRVVADMGSALPAPFMTLSFVSLPTVPALGLTDQGVIEIQEAFAAQVLADLVHMKMGPDDYQKVNVNGSGISLGHPIACTGTRVLVTLIHEMKRRGSRYALETICGGGGLGIAAVLEGV